MSLGVSLPWPRMLACLFSMTRALLMLITDGFQSSERLRGLDSDTFVLLRAVGACLMSVSDEIRLPAPEYTSRTWLTGTPTDAYRLSPRPEEPDVHLRFVWAADIFDYRGCRTAVHNFLRKWSEGHNPSITAAEILDGFLPKHRMPCEELWLQP